MHDKTQREQSTYSFADAGWLPVSGGLPTGPGICKPMHWWTIRVAHSWPHDRHLKSEPSTFQKSGRFSVPRPSVAAVYGPRGGTADQVLPGFCSGPPLSVSQQHKFVPCPLALGFLKKKLGSRTLLEIWYRKLMISQ